MQCIPWFILINYSALVFSEYLGIYEKYPSITLCTSAISARLWVIRDFDTVEFELFSHLNVSRIMVNSTNLPRRGTTRDVGGMISAKRRKNTVSDRRIEIERLTWNGKNTKLVNSIIKIWIQFWWNLKELESNFSEFINIWKQI